MNSPVVEKYLFSCSFLQLVLHMLCCYPIIQRSLCYVNVTTDTFLQSFGGRDWSLAGMSSSGLQAGETSGTLRREVSMKIKKKQLLSNQTFKVDPLPRFPPSNPLPSKEHPPCRTGAWGASSWSRWLCAWRAATGGTPPIIDSQHQPRSLSTSRMFLGTTASGSSLTHHNRNSTGKFCKEELLAHFAKVTKFLM